MWITDHTFRRLCLWLLTASLAVGAARAQTDDPMLFCMGTTVRLAGKDWAYVLWEVNAGATFPDEAIAVQARAGDFTAPGAFARITVAQRQSDPATVAWLIGRAEAIGQTAADLASLIDTVFADLALDPALTLEQRLAAVIRAAEENPEVAENLGFLARRHAAIAMAMGRAAVIPIAASGATTIELRAFDAATDRAGALRGRVGVTANTPRILPAPVNPVGASDNSPRGHLVMGLRWDITDAYRRVSLLGFGFNVYRVSRSFAEKNDFHITPPSRTELPSLLATYPLHVKRVNRLPVLYDEDDVPPGSPFFNDDNDRFDPNAAPFVAGQQFYYFVTACDVLGRDGTVSQGVLLTACDRLAPLVPLGLQARRLRTYDGAARDFGIEISWKPNPDVTNDTTSAYWVYRCASQDDPTFRARDPVLNRIGGPVAHTTNATRLVYIDTNVGEADFGRRYYYTVRAVDNGSCGPNWSGHSAPVACNLRDEDGPVRPNATLNTDYVTVTVTANEQPVNVAESPVDRGDFRLVCSVPSGVVRDALHHVEFYGRLVASNTASPELIGRYTLDPGASVVTSRYLRVGQNAQWYFWCKAVLKDGRESNLAQSNEFAPPSDPMFYRIASFNALGGITSVPSPVDDPHTVPPGSGPPTVDLHLDADAVEWRVYTQIDDGPLALARQGLGEPDTDITGIRADVERYLHCALVKYFVQTFDNNGNPSPLALIGRAFIPGATPSAVEYLAPEPTGTPAAPTFDLTWVASPHGVDHFEVFVGLCGDQPPDTLPGSGLSVNLDKGSGSFMLWRREDGAAEEVNIGRYETPRVGAAFGEPDSSLFTVRIPAALSKRYFVMVRPMSRCREGEPTPWQTVCWAEPAPPGQVTVPWPARPLPPVVADASSDIVPVFLPAYDYAGAVRRDTAAVVIGRVDGNMTEQHTRDEGYLLPTGDDIAAYLYAPGGLDDTLLPFVLYRRQVQNTLFPSVSGQYVQVTPLIESFASEIDAKATRRRMLDPYLVIGLLDPIGNESHHTICVRDRLGIVGGAAYEYYLMRFDARREPRDVHKLGTVTIPTR
jgi:hypothetical protein